MRKFSKIGAILLSLILMVSLITGNLYAKSGPAENSKKIDSQEGIPQTLPDPNNITIDPDNYDRQLLNGYYNYNCFVSSILTRTAKFYIPSNSVINQPTVIIVVPGGMTTWEFLMKSGWKKIADQEGIFIVLAEPASGDQWGNISDESKYLTELCADVAFRPFFCTFEAATYGIGYGEGAAILQENALSKPNRYAAVGLIGAPGVSAAKVSELQGIESSMSGTKLSQVQLPYWIVSEEKTDDVKRLVDYFKSADHSRSNPTDPETEFADSLYLPMAGGNVDEEWCAKVYCGIGDWEEYLTPGFTSNIFKRLFNGVRRYPGNGVNFLRAYKDIYKAGFEKFTGYVAGGFAPDGSDQYNRTWFVYQPKSVKANTPAPVVFVFHGAGGSGDEIADRSGWKKVADKYGLILVCPTGSHINTPRFTSDMWTTEYMRAMWNTGAATAERPNDLKFVEYLNDWVQKNYNVDATRVYAGGQSSGGSMSWAVTLKLPKIFAATSPVSSDLGSTTGADTSSIVPIIHFIGEKNPSFTSGFSSTSGKSLINYRVDRYKTVEKYDTFKYLLEGQVCSFKTGNFNNYVFKSKAGVPLLRAVEVTTSVHAIWPSECFAAWEEFFKYFTKTADGSLYYKGDLVVIE